jgi:hypothetical protein
LFRREEKSFVAWLIELFLQKDLYHRFDSMDLILL